MNKKQIWITVLLVGGYIALQLIADVTAVKIIDVFGMTFPAGTFVFALTFTWRDAIHKSLGKEWARASIVIAALCNLLMIGYFQLSIQLPQAVFWQNQDAFNSVLGVIWRITIASILAELASELVDTEMYHLFVTKITTKYQWLRVLFSNAISIPVDSVIFGLIAFYGQVPLVAIASICFGQIIFKMLVTIVSLPLIYVIK